MGDILDELKWLMKVLGVPWTLDTTPMMPEWKGDKSYGGREHRALVDLSRMLPSAVKEIERLRGRLYGGGAGESENVDAGSG